MVNLNLKINKNFFYLEKSSRQNLSDYLISLDLQRNYIYFVEKKQSLIGDLLKRYAFRTCVYDWLFRLNIFAKKNKHFFLI